MKQVWRILVPVANNMRWEFPIEHHKQWDAFVRKITGGVTIMKSSKGEWTSPTGTLFVEKMIPCEIICTEEEIQQIIDFTITHYRQEAVLAYKISDTIILKHKDEIK